ncbi:hypothetical protein AAFN47_25550 [Hoeflea sp. CAU 1731]
MIERIKGAIVDIWKGACVAVGTTILLFQSSIASADITTEQLNNVLVENAVIEPGKSGGNARLRFRVANLGANNLYLVKISTDIASSAQIKMRMPESGYESVSYVPIKLGETFDAETSHLVVEVQELRKDLVSGTEISFSVEFTDFTVAAFADVHFR